MKYKLTENSKTLVCGKTVHQIVALKSFGDVEAGELGGWVESESNLSYKGNCWVYGNAWVHGDTCVYGNAEVYTGDITKMSDVIMMPINYTNTTLTKSGVVCGCFNGTPKDFELAVINKYGDDYGVYADVIGVLKLKGWL